MSKSTLPLFLLALTALLFTINTSFGLVNYTISGEVRDAKSGEVLIGAAIYPAGNPARGVATNAYGFFSITLPEGTYELATQFVGYERQVQSINLNQNMRINIDLKESVVTLGEVTIKGEREDHNITSSQMGNTKLNIAEIKNIPVLFGEKDVLKTIQLLPGVKSAGEGERGFLCSGWRSRPKPYTP